ncbi:MAG: type II toxin-antitoxin system HicA family toxin [Xenococcaceae cyanobacterium MO_188.B29]|nr:type II toxin-antitoxin system HicA family toxin [Xenococcaceae cyanobacterium MO_188.B29]
MPKKIRELKSMLLKAGCISEPGKGSHTKWKHPLINRKIILSGNDGADAKRYQEKEVMQLLKDIKKAQS